MPDILFFNIKSKASFNFLSFEIVTGLTTIPDSNFFTFLTSSICSSIFIFLWIEPMPPDWAIAIAIWDSVTVSIAAEIIGISKLTDLVNNVLVFTFFGKIEDDVGFNNTSSKVRESCIFLPIYNNKDYWLKVQVFFFILEIL